MGHTLYLNSSLFNVIGSGWLKGIQFCVGLVFFANNRLLFFKKRDTGFLFFFHLLTFECVGIITALPKLSVYILLNVSQVSHMAHGPFV